MMILSIFAGVYDLSVGVPELHYLALGLELGGASQVNARTTHRLYVYLKVKP